MCNERTQKDLEAFLRKTQKAQQSGTSVRDISAAIFHPSLMEVPKCDGNFLRFFLHTDYTRSGRKYDL